MRVFYKSGWSYHIHCTYLARLTKRLGLSCAGATDYSKKRICVSNASSTLHEFGHFLDYALGFPAKHQELYEAEADAAARLMRDYTKTSSREFFANRFAYWYGNRGSLE